MNGVRNGGHHRHGVAYDIHEMADSPLNPKPVVPPEGDDEDSPLQRPRPPERIESRGLSRDPQNGSGPWTQRLSQRASQIWQSAPDPYGPEHYGRQSKRERGSLFTCGQALCAFALPAVIVCVLLLVLSSLATYFTTKQV